MWDVCSTETHRHFLVSEWLLLAALAWAWTLPWPVDGSPGGCGRGCVLEHGHETFVYCPPGLAALLKQQEDHGVLDEGRKHEENADHEIKVNSIETWGNRSLLPEITSWMRNMFANNPFTQLYSCQPGTVLYDQSSNKPSPKGDDQLLSNIHQETNAWLNATYSCNAQCKHPIYWALFAFPVHQ